jgi:hypothetical protein
MLGIGLSIPKVATSGGGSAAAAMLIDNLSVAEGSAAGTLIGTLSIVNSGGVPLYTLTDDAGGRIGIDGAEIQVGGTALDYEAGTSHNFTVSVSGLDPAIEPRTFTVAVTNVLEVSLSALTLSVSTIADDALVGDVVGALVSTTSGSTLSLVDDSGGRYALDGLNIEVNAALGVGSDAITVRETHPDGSNSPRDTVLGITVTEADVPVEADTFYFSNDGDDTTGDGTEALPWETITKANSLSLEPGQTVLFNRGDTFTGGIVLQNSGAVGDPIGFGAYGSGADPIISSSAAEGFFAENVEYFSVEDLEFRGDAITPNAVNGIHVENSEENDTQLSGVQLARLTVSEYGDNGIAVFGNNGISGFTSPLIQDCEVFNCTHNSPLDGWGSAGIYVRSRHDDGFGAGTNGFTIVNPLIEDCLVYD